MNPSLATQKPEPAWLRHVRSQAKSLRFGVVQIVVHDSQVAQIETTEGVRLKDGFAEELSSRPAPWRRSIPTKTDEQSTGQPEASHHEETYPA
jgi:hypothetical protein